MASTSSKMPRCTGTRPEKQARVSYLFAKSDGMDRAELFTKSSKFDLGCTSSAKSSSNGISGIVS